MGDDLAAAVVQLRDDPDGAQPPAAVGPETSGRSGLEVRVRDRQCRERSDDYRRIAARSRSCRCRRRSCPNAASRPANGGCSAFLVSEVAFFSTLIVVYLASIWRPEQSGPTPAVLSLPLVIGTTICLLSSSVTVHLAGSRCSSDDRSTFVRLVVGDDRARRPVPGGHRLRMARADRRARSDDQPQSVRHHVITRWSAFMPCT